jgi:hypothetical protein
MQDEGERGDFERAVRAAMLYVIEVQKRPRRRPLQPLTAGMPG